MKKIINKELELSKRAISIPESPIRKLKPLADQARARGIKIYHLNIGQPDIKTPSAIIKVYQKYNDEVLAYGPASGLDIYRQNLVNYYQKKGIKIKKDNLIVTTAGSEAIVFALMAVCNFGDEIIVPEPFYANYNAFAKIVGIKILALTTSAQDGYKLPQNSEIEKLITKKTKAILICNPNNPTGLVLAKKDMQRLAQIAKNNNLYIISDEVYREFAYDNRQAISFLSIKGIQDNVIVVDSISKRYSACGARIGCLISRNSKIMKSVLKFAQARLCPPTIDQLAANAAINIKDTYFIRLLKKYEQRRDIVFAELNKIDGVSCKKPGGAFYMMLSLPVKDAEDFTKWLLTDFSRNKETLMLAPGHGFYATPGLGKNEVRIAYVLNKKDLKRAIYLLAEALKEYRNKKPSK